MNFEVLTILYCEKNFFYFITNFLYFISFRYNNHTSLLDIILIAK